MKTFKLIFPILLGCLVTFSCEKDNVFDTEIANQTTNKKFTIDRAKKWYNEIGSRTRSSKQNRTIFKGENFYWDYAEKEVNDYGETFYIQFVENDSYVVSSDDEGKLKKDKNKEFSDPFSNIQKMAITKKADGTVSMKFVLYIPDKASRKNKNKVFEKFDGRILFFDNEEKLIDGLDYKNGKIEQYFYNGDNPINKNKNAKLCVNCFPYYIDWYSYAYGGGYYGHYQYMYTATYQLCVPCNGNFGNSITTTGTTGGSAGSSSGSFAPDGSFSGATNIGRPYDRNTTILLNPSECGAYNETRAKANLYGVEYSGLVLAGSNGPIYLTLPSEGHTNTLSITSSVYEDVAWGEGFNNYFDVLIDLTNKKLTVKFNPYNILYEYNIIRHFHTHPVPNPGQTNVISPADKAFANSYPGLNYEVWDYNGIYQYWGNGSTSSLRGCNY